MPCCCVLLTLCETQKIIAEHNLDLTPAVTHTFALSKFEEAFKVLFAGQACKIVLDPNMKE